MRNKKRMDQFLTIYNCSADNRPAPEIIAVDSIRHVWMRLPDETQVTIEYYRQSTDSLCSMTEYYKDKVSANNRMEKIRSMLGCNDWTQNCRDGIMLDWQYEANNE